MASLPFLFHFGSSNDSALLVPIQRSPKIETNRVPQSHGILCSLPALSPLIPNVFSHTGARSRAAVLDILGFPVLFGCRLSSSFSLLIWVSLVISIPDPSDYGGPMYEASTIFSRHRRGLLSSNGEGRRRKRELEERETACLAWSVSCTGESHFAQQTSSRRVRCLEVLPWKKNRKADDSYLSLKFRVQFYHNPSLILYHDTSLVAPVLLTTMLLPFHQPRYPLLPSLHIPSRPQTRR